MGYKRDLGMNKTQPSHSLEVWLLPQFCVFVLALQSGQAEAISEVLHQVGVPVNWKHPCRGLFSDSIVVRKPVELFQGPFGCGTEWKGHRLWRQAAIIHLFEPQFSHL